ncbi:RNA-directed DNA polymerase from mobile element jockey [Trichonephila clavipes]|nr:RNA-directed DNA polymerase from mobile element jockey [Trichonephila clavipes]
MSRNSRREQGHVKKDFAPCTKVITDISTEVLTIYTDGSKFEDVRVGSGVFISNYEVDGKFSTRNTKFCSVCRAEIIAIGYSNTSLSGLGLSKLVYFQWIPSHVEVYRNETTDSFTRSGRDLLITNSADLTALGIHSLYSSKLVSTWRLPPDHNWYAACRPGLSGPGIKSISIDR